MKNKKGAGRPRQTYKYKSVITGEYVDCFTYRKEINQKKAELKAKPTQLEVLKALSVILGIKLEVLYNLAIDNMIEQSKTLLNQHLNTNKEVQ